MAVSAASLPLPSGAATAAKQPALGTAGTAATDVISVQGIASMTALKTDSSATTQPVSAASLPLPSGAATSAKQAALGTAGTASADVLSVQGIASMTALKVDGSAVTQPISDGGGSVTVDGAVTVTNATPGNLNTVAFGWDDTNNPALHTDTAGNQMVVGTVAHDAVDTGNPLKIGGKARSSAPADVSTTGDRVDAYFDMKGRLKVDASDAPVPITDNGGSVTVDGTVAVSGTVSVAQATATTGGYTIYRNLDVQSTGVNIKGSAGQVYGWYIANNASSVRYVKLYNKASTPTVGTDTPVMTIPIPANGAANVSFPHGIAFSLGIGIGGVTAVADNSTAAPTANDLIANVFYA